MGQGHGGQIAFDYSSIKKSIHKLQGTLWSLMKEKRLLEPDQRSGKFATFLFLPNAQFQLLDIYKQSICDSARTC